MDRPAIHDRYWGSYLASLVLCEKELGEVSGKKVAQQDRTSLHMENKSRAKTEESVDEAFSVPIGDG